MKKYLVVVVLGLLIIAGGAYFYFSQTTNSTPNVTVGYKDSTYSLEGESIVLTNGESRVPAGPDSGLYVVTKYFGNEATGDLNGDGMPDVAFIITQNGGGSGTFYYAVVALKTANGYQGTNGVLLGDRIAPQSTEIKGGQVVVTYADRKAGEPMVVQPSVGISKYLKVQGTTLVEVK